MKPDDKYYEPWHQWLKENRSEWYETAITNERIRNGKSMGIASGPVSGIKQKIYWTDIQRMWNQTIKLSWIQKRCISRYDVR